MLKIKDSVNLKDLEKYRFEYQEDWDDQGKMVFYRNNGLYVNVYPEDRKLDEMGFGFDNKDADVLYDLIKDGLIEKIDNEK